MEINLTSEDYEKKIEIANNILKEKIKQLKTCINKSKLDFNNVKLIKVKDSLRVDSIQVCNAENFMINNREKRRFSLKKGEEETNLADSRNQSLKNFHLKDSKSMKRENYTMNLPKQIDNKKIIKRQLSRTKSLVGDELIALREKNDLNKNYYEKCKKDDEIIKSDHIPKKIKKGIGINLLESISRDTSKKIASKSSKNQIERKREGNVNSCNRKKQSKNTTLSKYKTISNTKKSVSKIKKRVFPSHTYETNNIKIKPGSNGGLLKEYNKLIKENKKLLFKLNFERENNRNYRLYTNKLINLNEKKSSRYNYSPIDICKTSSIDKKRTIF